MILKSGSRLNQTQLASQDPITGQCNDNKFKVLEEINLDEVSMDTQGAGVKRQLEDSGLEDLTEQTGGKTSKIRKAEDGKHGTNSTILGSIDSILNSVHDNAPLLSRG